MNVGLWAEIRRLAEIEKLSGWAISRRLRCSRHTVAKALKWDQPPGRQASHHASLLDPHKAEIDAILARHPELSAVRIRQEIARGPDGYTGSTGTIRRYLRTVRPAQGRVYQEVHYEPAQAMQVDWGECGSVQLGATTRKVSVFVAVLFALPVSIPSSWPCAAAITCSRSPANVATPNRKGSSRGACVMSSTTPWRGGVTN